MRKMTLRTSGEVEPCGGSKRQMQPTLPPGYRERHVAKDQRKEHKKPAMAAVWRRTFSPQGTEKGHPGGGEARTSVDAE